LPQQPLALTLRVLAFALVIAATALTPPPVEAPRGGIRPPEALQS